MQPFGLLDNRYSSDDPRFALNYAGGGVSGQTPTNADAIGRLAYGLTNVGGVQDAAGLLGGPSVAENIKRGNNLDASLQMLAALPMVGMLGTAGKAAKAAKVGEAIAEIPAADKLLALHNMKSHRLDMVDKLGGLPAPSIAITKPEQGFNSFGDITLVGGKEFATPSKVNPVYGADVYSPRFPSIDDETGRIFRGFTDSGNRRYAPLTMENVLREMKGNVRGGEGYNYGPGSVRASVTPQFKSLEAVQSARGKIIPKEEFEAFKNQSNDKLFELADKFHPYSQYSNSSFGHATSFAETLSDIGKGRLSAWSQDYKDLPDELKQEAYDYLASLKNMPTEYFEAKPQRAVSINEFGGAVIPQELAAEVTPWLQNQGINRIETFDKSKPGSQAEALKKFQDLMFNFAPFGLLGGAAIGSTGQQQAQPGV